MNKNLVLKILGIIGGLLIAASVFLPYSSGASLLKINVDNKQLYLSIIIILFGVLAAVLHFIEKKVEFSYMSVGALGFYLIIQIVDTVSSGTFKNFNLGFYLLLIGTILITITTFILDRKSKVKVLDEQIAPISNDISNPSQRSVLDIINDSSINMEPQENQIEDSTIVDLSDNVEISTINEEIPDYRPEDEINPVLAEFSIPQESNTNVQTSSGLINELPASNSINPVAELAAEVLPEASIQQSQENVMDNTLQGQQNSVIASQATIDTASQNQIFGVQSQPEIAFDEPQQSIQQTEIPEVSQEPQVDIFGQPK